MMKLSSFHLMNPKLLHLPKLPKTLKPLPKLPSNLSSHFKQCIKTEVILKQAPKQDISELVVSSGFQVPKWVIMGSTSLGLAFLILGLGLGLGFEMKAMALGPEGPIVEEFWDNMRRYGLYILTVSSGAIYTILLPLIELLKNPFTALVLVVVVVAAFYLISTVLGAMTGLSDFSYQYSY
ncbi:uncharacterized protein LOC120277999 [Dioscorea cayenensis subsp. rotundata]|uniref:Uncharacterized protein ycf33 n=1 Tax=Dioscorea cayennensis subsp. rotundata TaxID=55577 RepID=A0AB40CN80_DIOCR|nr:uncharacterized protein LOC120277999 [Dioscorea cayenensis subsp. rotundata]